MYIRVVIMVNWDLLYGKVTTMLNTFLFVSFSSVMKWIQVNQNLQGSRKFKPVFYFIRAVLYVHVNMGSMRKSVQCYSLKLQCLSAVGC